MALTVAVGNDGGFTTLSGYNGTYFAWDAEFSQVIGETTGYSDNFRTYRGGIMGATFNVNGTYNFDASSTAPMPELDAAGLTKTPAAITLTAASGCTFAGSAIIETTRMSNDRRTNEATLQQSGRFSGSINQTWDESP